jgi:PrtD family type I secretion system ABC transporter
MANTKNITKIENDQKSVIRFALSRYRAAFISIGVFSAFINMLMLVSPMYMLQVYDRVLSSRSEPTLVILTVFCIGLLAVYGFLEFARSRVLVRVGVELDKNLSEVVLKNLFTLSLKSGNVRSSQALRDLSTVREFLSGSAILTCFDAPWFPFYIAVIFIFHPLQGFIGIFGAILLFSFALAGEIRTRGLLSEASKNGIAASRFVDLSLRNTEVIHAMGMLSRIAGKWNVYNSQMLGNQALASDRAGTLSALTRFSRIGIQILILGSGAFLVLQDQLTAGSMIAISIILSRALAPVEMAVGSWKQVLAARGANDRLKELLAIEDWGKTGQIELPVPKGKIEVSNAFLAPPGEPKRPILKQISFVINPGEIIGVVGPSGAGKSSLARLLMGVWKPLSGEVRLDGSEYEAWPQEVLGAYFGYLPQDVELFEGSIAENIARFGEIDSNKIIEAASCAGVHELITKLPDGYQTQVGVSGQTLSGGERQRIGLARALYGDPKFIVLDEPNSNLDQAGEEALSSALKRLRTNKQTCVVITHRPALLANVDRVMIMIDGSLIKMGPPSEVLPQVLKKPQTAETRVVQA